MNVVELIVKNDFCIGCGVCAGMCPSNNLYMKWSNKGELVPKSKDICKKNCSACLDVCPFNNHDINQDDIANILFSKNHKINYDIYTGYYLDCYVGFQKDEKKRLISASGGLATSFLASLIEENVVDKVIAVGIFEDNDRMFDFKILSNSDEVYSCAGSAYYPVEISLVLKKILKENEENNYAVIALPCVVYALRLAMEKFPKLKRKIKIIASLTCGQLQNRFCTELLALESGIKVNELSMIDFRRKSSSNSASNFLQIPVDKQANEGIPQPYNKLPFHLWHYRYFTQNACNFCDDIFGETADITFMDAWLPNYVKDYRGTSLVIVRNQLINDLIKTEIKEKHIKLDNIDILSIIKSQSTPVYKKREILAGRLYLVEKLSLWHPKKRINSNKDIYFNNKEYIELTAQIQEESKKIWPLYYQDESTKRFWNKMKYYETKIKKLERVSKIKSLMSSNSILNLIENMINIIKG